MLYLLSALHLMRNKLVILLLLTTSAFAGEWDPGTNGPMFTDTPEALKFGYWEVNPYVADYINPDPTQNVIQISPSLNYGLGKGWELDANVQYLSAYNVNGFGNSSLTVKKELIHDSDTYHFWGIPTITAEVTATLPTGNALVAGETYQTLQVVAKKRFRPFSLSAEVGVGPFNSYTFGSFAFEQVLDEKSGFGYILEATGAATPSGSYVQAGPILEISGWPNTGKGNKTTYGFGVYFPVSQTNYPAYIAPMMSINFSFH